MKTEVKFGLIIAIIAILGVTGFALLGPRSMKKFIGPCAKMTLAYSPFEHATLLWIAEDQRFFSQNGLDVTIRKYDTGVGSLDGMLNGEADITVGVTEFPTVGWAFRKAGFRIIGSVAKIEQIYLVGRKDRGIEKVSDLKGKMVGTTFRTIAEFHLGRFLDLHGMNMQEDVALVDVKTPAEWVNAVANGEIDAIATAQPYVNSAKERLGANAVIWPAQSSQPIFGLIAATDEWIKKHPELVTRFLESMAQAEEYSIRHPAEAKAIVQKQLNLDAAYMETRWSQNRFSLSLDQSLILAMEDEARWMIINNLTAEKQIPNFLDYIHENSLKAIKPEAVNIIR